jgi:uncharacterized protein YprB with RNaseH-like and TPR domain
MEDSFVSNRIAVLYHDGYSHKEISEKLADEGIFLHSSNVGRRIKRMIANGTIDIEKEEPKFLDELSAELGTDKMFKIGFLDIETTGLWSDFGYILCAVIKHADEDKFEVLRIDDYFSYPDDKKKWMRIDKELLVKLREAYEKFDIIMHFNGRNFDIKFINTRCIKNGVPMLPEMKQLDIYQIAKHKLRLRSKRLDSLKSFLEIDNDEEGHKWEYWQMAGAGMKTGIDFVVDHCKRDVTRLEKVAKAMKYQINFIGK